MQYEKRWIFSRVYSLNVTVDFVYENAFDEKKKKKRIQRELPWWRQWGRDRRYRNVFFPFSCQTLFLYILHDDVGLFGGWYGEYVQ